MSSKSPSSALAGKDGVQGAVVESSGGMAISGGVDSMALAALYARLAAARKDPTSAHAFIVDHKVRPGSTEEAEWVAEQCRSKFGMEASVLPLSWPSDFDPLDHKRFETDARTLRYQALGQACREANVYKLLVAHHADDQAETVMMRLANGRLRLGLQAMQPVEWIPECDGLHGISHSGVTYGRFGYPALEHIPFPVESGGIKIVRPLLNFSKARLLATCKHHGVAWAEDKTNHLQTYTSRNAVRHVLNNHELPAALSMKSLVDVSRHMQQRVAMHKDRAERLFNECKMRLDIRTGSLHVCFPSFNRLVLDLQVIKKPHEALGPSDLVNARNTAAYLLARVGQLIAPRQSPPLPELAAIVGNIWPEFQELEEADIAQTGASESDLSYCVYGIWWRKWDRRSRSVEEGHRKRSDKMDWFLTRQPVEHRHRTSDGFVYPPSSAAPPKQVGLPLPPGNAPEKYQLFDNRWWIAVRNNCTDELRLRFFMKDDLAQLRGRDTGRKTASIATTALALLETADLRLNLPALFRFNATTNRERLVGFPTLNVSVGNYSFHKEVCTWRVHYKKIDLHPNHLAEVIVPGVTPESIEGKTSKVSDSLRKRRDFKERMDRKEWWQDRAEEKKRKAESHTEEQKQNAGDPLVPTVESKRRGRSQNREGGGYDIKWKDAGHRQ